VYRHAYGPDEKPGLSYWISLLLGGFGGWSAFWAVVWSTLVLSEANSSSAADEGFTLAIVASSMFAVVTSVGGRTLALRRQVDPWWPAMSWLTGYVCAAMFFCLFMLAAAGSTGE
jgi:hypothetical protein